MRFWSPIFNVEAVHLEITRRKKMKASVLHDEHGKIIAISKIGDLKHTGSKFTKVGMVPGRGQRIIETELSAEDNAGSLRELHEAYHVDIATSKLVKAKR
jgi:hypothetical protein